MRISDWSSDVCASGLPTSASPSGPTATASRAATSASATKTPRASNRCATALLPEATPPVSPTMKSLMPRLWRRSGLRPRRLSIFVGRRSEEHTSELQSLMRISYAVFCLKTKTQHHKQTDDLLTLQDSQNHK